MKISLSPVVAAVVLGSLALSSCDTPVGQGAGFGAGAGAIIGGLAGGNVRSAATGAAIGAASGALIGAAVQEDQRRSYSEPAGGYPYGRHSGSPGFVYSPYAPHNLIDVRGIPHGSLVRDPSTGGLFIKP